MQFSPPRDRSNCKNFAGSAALVEVCTFHVLPVIGLIIIIIIIIVIIITVVVVAGTL